MGNRKSRAKRRREIEEDQVQNTGRKVSPIQLKHPNGPISIIIEYLPEMEQL